MDIAQSSVVDDSQSYTKETLLSELTCRREKYTSVKESAEAEGNASKVRRYNRIIKQYDNAITFCKGGKPCPLGELPNPPGFGPLVNDVTNSSDLPNQLTTDANSRANLNVSPRPDRKLSPSPIRRAGAGTGTSPLPPRKIQNENVLQSSEEISAKRTRTVNPIPIFLNDEDVTANNQANEASEKAITLQDLTSRLEVYKSVKKAAEDENNSSKARRYTRIIKQYDDAIALCNAGKDVPLDELPNPPGFPPLVPVKSAPPSPLPSRSEVVFNPGKNLEPAEQDKTGPHPTVNAPQQQHHEVNPTVPTKVVTRSDKQTAFLKERQKEYRNAALTAKKLGQLSEAKEFLKLCKGFDRLILASESGLPVDLTTIPVSLSAKKEIEEESFHMVTDQDFAEGNDNEIYVMLENELTAQIKSCMNTRNSFKLAGDIANANRFEQYALHFKKDLNSIKVSHSNNYPIPKFHYENRTFSTILCNSDLNDNDLQLVIVQGINYKVAKPNDVDTYVTYEFPYPSESPPTGRTSVVKNTNNPKYEATFNFTIHRDIRACQRIFKRQGIKLEVWSKGGIFRSDTLLGTVVVKLMPLNTEIHIHEAFDLMNGRRPAGGKLEVKIRVREPVFAKKMETVTEKWLIMDYK